MILGSYMMLGAYTRTRPRASHGVGPMAPMPSDGHLIQSQIQMGRSGAHDLAYPLGAVPRSAPEASTGAG